MSKGFPYEERARYARETHRLFREAFSRVLRRLDENDPATIEWHRALTQFRQAQDATFPGGFRNAWSQLSAGTLPLSDILDFMTADPYFPDSGYFKSAALRRLKHLSLDERDAKVLRFVILTAIERGGSQELPEFSGSVAASGTMQWSSALSK